MGINDWQEDERPRERLLENGPESLSNAELLAIFLRVGLPGQSAVDLGRNLLQAFDLVFVAGRTDGQRIHVRAGIAVNRPVDK